MFISGIVFVSSGYPIDALENANQKNDFHQIELPNSIISELELKVEESDLNGNNGNHCYQSSEVKLYDIPWKIEMCKENEQVFKVSLVSAFERYLATSSRLAAGKLLLLNKNGENHLEKTFKKRHSANLDQIIYYFLKSGQK